MLVEIMFRSFGQMVLGHSVSGHVGRRCQQLKVPETGVRPRRLLGNGRQLCVVQVLDGGRVLENDKFEIMIHLSAQLHRQYKFVLRLRIKFKPMYTLKRIILNYVLVLI